METGFPVGKLAISNTSKVLFAAMAGENTPGSVRCYKLAPLVGDYVEFQAHSSAIARMRISYDDNYLFTVGLDGCICVFEIRDKEARSIKRDKEGAGISYGDEIIIKKQEVENLTSTIEEISREISEKKYNTDLDYKLKKQEK